MSHKLFTHLSLTVILALAFASMGVTGTAMAMPSCDPAYVTIAGTEITVLPTGTSDTANLKCAFDAATAAPGTNIRLVAGVYNTGQIVANGFQGQFTGAGMYQTKIVNLPGLYVTPVDFYFDRPSAENPAPFLFSFYNGDITIMNLAFHINGGDETTGWSIYGIDPPIEELASAVSFLGTKTNARIENVLLEGVEVEGSLFGYSVINGIYYEGFTGANPSPISGSFRVSNSIFRSVASGSPISNVVDSTIVITHNSYEEVFWGFDGAAFTNSSLEVSHNRINAVIGIDLYDQYLPAYVGSTFLVNNNLILAQIGLLFEQTLGEDNQCLALGNNLQQVTDIGVYLGPGIHGCTVVGSGSKTNVLDLGEDNILVGVNNMGTGVGPTIQSLLKMRK